MKKSTLHTLSLSMLLAGCTIAPDPGGVASNYTPNTPERRTLGYHETKKKAGTTSNPSNTTDLGVAKDISATQTGQITATQGLCGVLKSEFNFEPHIENLNWGGLAGVIAAEDDEDSCLPEHKSTLDDVTPIDMEPEEVASQGFPLPDGSPYETSIAYLLDQKQPIYYIANFCLDEQDKSNKGKWSVTGKLLDNQQNEVPSGEPVVTLDPKKSFIEFDEKGTVIAFTTSYVRQNVPYQEFPSKVTAIQALNDGELEYIITRLRNNKPVLFEKRIEINIAAKGSSSAFAVAYDKSFPKAAVNCFYAYGGKIGGALKKWSVEVTTGTTSTGAVTTKKEPSAQPPKTPSSTAELKTSTEAKTEVPPPVQTSTTREWKPVPVDELKVVEKQPDTPATLPVQTAAKEGVEPKLSEEKDNSSLPKDVLSSLNFESENLPAPIYQLASLDKEAAEKLNKKSGYRFAVATDQTVTKSEINTRCKDAQVVIKPSIFKVKFMTPKDFDIGDNGDSTTTFVGKIKKRFDETAPIYKTVKKNLDELKNQPKTNYFELAGCYDSDPSKTYLFFHNNVSENTPSDETAQWYPFSKPHSKVVYLEKQRKLVFRALFSYVMPNTELRPLVGGLAAFIANPTKWPRADINWAGTLKFGKSENSENVVSSLPSASIRSSKKIRVSIHSDSPIKTDWDPENGKEFVINNKIRDEYIVVPNQNMMSFVGPMDVLKFEFAPAGS